MALSMLAVIPVAAADLKSQTVEAFDRYVRQARERLSARKNFLWADESPDRLRRLRQGETIVEPFGKNPVIKVPDGLIHDWIGGTFLAGVPLARVVALVQDYDRHKEYYKPEVVDSKLLSHEGNHFRIYLRLLKKQILTVVLFTEHDVRYEAISPTRWQSTSVSTKIAEVDDAGKPGERVLPTGTGHGFMWKLDSFWRFEERDSGTWVEFETITLSRDIPFGLGFAIEPIIRNLPKESMEKTLRATKATLVK